MSNKQTKSDLTFDVTGLRFNPKKSRKTLDEKITKPNETTFNNNQSPKDFITPIETISAKQKVFFQSHINNESSQYQLAELNKALEAELREKKEEIKILKKNYKEKISLIEQENRKNIDQLEEKYNELITKINQNCDNKIEEIKDQYNQNISKINQQYLNILNEIRTIRTNSITLTTHYNKINELNIQWEKKLKNLKEEYEIKLKQITNKLKENLNFENINEYNKDNNIANEKKEYEMIQMISKIKLQHKIRYYSYILDLQEKYNEQYLKLNLSKIEKLENLKNYTSRKFDSLLGISEISSIPISKDNSNSIKNDNNTINNTLDARKKSELVNYDTTKIYLQKNSIHNSNNRRIGYDVDSNNLITSPKMNEQFSSDLMSFNFNDDTLPNREIQILSPPELIK